MGKLDPMTEAEAKSAVEYYEKGGTLLNNDHLNDYLQAKSLLRGLKLGRIEGQKDMRERAAKAAMHFDNGKNELIQDDTARVVADAIRALPIEGE